MRMFKVLAPLLMWSATLAAQGRVATTTTLTSSLNPALPAQTVTLRAAVTSQSGRPPTGTVSFGPFGSATLVNGVASLSIASLAVGTHRIVARYSGAPGFRPSVSDVLQQVVLPTARTKTVVTTSGTPTPAGQAVTFTATVTSPGFTPTGTASFIIDGTPAGSAVAVVGGVAAFSTSALAVGRHTVSARFSDGASFSPSASAPITQVVDPANPLSITPAVVDFGQVVVGVTSTPSTLTLRNSGSVATGPLTLTNPTGDGDFNGTATNCTAGGLAAGASCGFAFTFTPTTTGPRTRSLTISATPGGSVTMTLVGTGMPVPRPVLALTPTAYDFGSVGVGVSSPPAVFTLTNTGTGPSGPLTIGGIQGANPGDFSGGASSTCSSGELAVGASCTITLVFTPQAVGSRSAIFGLGATPGGTVTATLTGTGTATQWLTVNPTSFDYGSSEVGTTSAAHRFIITNTGPSATGPLGTAGFQGANPTAFAGVGASSTCDDILAVGLAAGASCDLDLTFTPQAAGAESASLSFSATPGGSVTIQVAGTGTTTAYLTLTPSPLDFGPVVVGVTSPQLTVTLTNTGSGATGPLTLSNPTGDGDFLGTATNCTAGGLAAGASCGFAFTFTPTTTGPRTRSLTISATPGGSVTITLVGTGMPVPRPVLALSPTTFDFGSVGVGVSSPPAVFTMTNTGTGPSGPLTLGGLQGANPGDFSGGASTTCSSNGLAAGASCTITLMFTPQAVGSRSAIFGLATPGGTVTATLTGTGTATQWLTASPTSFDFGTINPGTTSAPQRFIITNTGPAGTGPLGTAGFQGANPGAFAGVGASSTCDDIGAVGLAAGASCDLDITFTPPADGSYSASLTFSATPGGAVTIQLTGSAAFRIVAITISPTTYDFGAVLVGGDAVKFFTVTNASPTAVRISGDALIQVVPGFGLDPFSTCVLVVDSLEPGGTCTVGVHFKPLTPGTVTQTLRVYADPDLTATAALTATGTLPALAITPTAHDFGLLTVGQTSAPVLFQVDQYFFATIASAGIGVLGPGASSYAMEGGDSCAENMTHSGQGSCFASIRFAPSGTGPQPATLMAQFTAADGTIYTATSELTGNGVAPIVLSVAPSSRDFGSVIVGGTGPTATFTVTNPSTSKLTLDPITVTGTNPADFVVGPGKLSCANILEPGAFCVFDVAFSPRDVGARAASVTISAGPATQGTTVALTGSGAPALTIAPASKDFGGIVVGQSSAPASFTVTNVGSASVLINHFSVAGHFTDFTVAPGSCGPALATGASCTFSVTFSPKAAGARSATVTAVAEGGLPTASATLTGSGTATPGLAFNPASFDFGSRQINFVFGGVVFFTVTNTGSAATGVLDQTVFSGAGGADFSADPVDNRCMGVSLAPGGSCTLSVQFIPAALGLRSATLTVSSSGSGTSGFAQVTGTGVPPAVLSVTPLSKDFGSVDLGQSALFTFTVTNTGPSPGGLFVTENRSGPGRDDYAEPSSSCWSTLLNVGTSCQIQIAFSPKAGGPRPATITLVFQGGNATINVTGTGTSANALMSLAPDSLDFGVVFLGASSATRTLTVTNIGRATSGPLVNFLFTGPGAYEFLLAGSNQCSGLILAPGAHCTLGLSFSPQVYGVRKATLTVSDGGLGGTATLTGGMIPGGVLSMTPTAASFGTIAVGSSSLASSFTVTNSGTTVALFSGVFIDDPAGAGDDYTVDPSGSCANTPSLAIGASCTVLVHFAPKRTGPLPATLYVSYDAGSVTAALTGTGAAAGAQFTLTPLSHDFGSYTVGQGTGVTFAFSVTNIGSLAAPVSATLTGPGTDAFSLPANACGLAPLAPQASCDITVGFLPPTSGARTATLTVSATSGNSVAATLTGTGTDQPTIALRIAPDTFLFTSIPVGATSPPATFTVTNLLAVRTGTINTFGLTGVNTTDYLISEGTCAGATLDPGGSCTFSVTFAPQNAGGHRSTLTVRTSAGETGTTQLRGFGIVSAVLRITPASQDFGFVYFGQSAPVTFTVTNSAGNVAAVLDFTFAGPNSSDFIPIVDGYTCAYVGQLLLPGASCTIGIMFQPPVLGPRSATFTVTDVGGLGSSTATATLTGGVTPGGVLTISPTSKNFGTVPVGFFTLPTEFIVTNVGTTIALLSGVAVVNPTDINFVLEPGSTCGPFLEVGARCSISVVFVPIRTGPLQATLLVSYDAGTASASLTGTGGLSGTAVRTAAASAAIELTPFSATDATRDLLGVPTLSPARRSYLDLLGNHDGSYDLGDLLAFLDRHHVAVSPALLRAAEHHKERVP